MARFQPDSWSPNAMERKCLAQLDSAENWEQILKRQKPAESERLDWRPFGRIFLFNWVFFAVALAFLLVVVTAGVGGMESLSEFKWEISGFVVAGSVVTAAYATNLYRRSWNRRAMQLATQME